MKGAIGILVVLTLTSLVSCHEANVSGILWLVEFLPNCKSFYFHF